MTDLGLKIHVIRVIRDAVNPKGNFKRSVNLCYLWYLCWNKLWCSQADEQVFWVLLMRSSFTTNCTHYTDFLTIYFQHEAHEYIEWIVNVYEHFWNPVTGFITLQLPIRISLALYTTDCIFTMNLSNYTNNCCVDKSRSIRAKHLLD